MNRLVKIKLDNCNDILEFLIWADNQKLPYLYAEKCLSLLKFTSIFKQAFIKNEGELYLIYNKRGVGIDYSNRTRKYKHIIIPYSYFKSLYNIEQEVLNITQQNNKYFNFIINESR
jgi:hypothetical protein